MTDITKCFGEDCACKETCWRFVAPSSLHRQSFFVKVPGKDTSCEHYWRIENEDKKRIRK